MKNYNDMIRECRVDKDLTQKQVAEALGIRQQVYSRYENGERSLPVEHLIKLCKLYEVSSDHLLCINNTDKNKKNKR